MCEERAAGGAKRRLPIVDMLLLLRFSLRPRSPRSSNLTFLAFSLADFATLAVAS